MAEECFGRLQDGSSPLICGLCYTYLILLLLLRTDNQLSLSLSDRSILRVRECGALDAVTSDVDVRRGFVRASHFAHARFRGFCLILLLSTEWVPGRIREVYNVSLLDASILLLRLLS